MRFTQFIEITDDQGGERPTLINLDRVCAISDLGDGLLALRLSDHPDASLTIRGDFELLKKNIKREFLTDH